MDFAPKGLKVGDTFVDCYGNTVRITEVFDYGYNTEPVEEQISLADLPFSYVEETPKKRGGRRKKTEE